MRTPRYSRGESELTIEVIDCSASMELVEAVVDVDDFGEVIGIEILGLMSRHPGIADHGQYFKDVTSEVALEFDPDADAIYLRLSSGDGRPLDQLMKPAAVLLSPDDSLAKVVVQMD